MRPAMGSCKYILRDVASSGVRVARTSNDIKGKSILGTSANILRRGGKCQSARKLKLNKRETHKISHNTFFTYSDNCYWIVSEHTDRPFHRSNYIWHNSHLHIWQIMHINSFGYKRIQNCKFRD
jgi:hypothetical protein